MPNNIWVSVGASYKEEFLPDDTEKDDLKELRVVMEEYLDKKYPSIEPEIIYGSEKEYYLPALKVLMVRNGEFFSPQRSSHWNNMELRAACGNDGFLSADGSISHFAHRPHKSPDRECPCGIYGSVNLEEIKDYIDDCKQKAKYPIYTYNEIEIPIQEDYTVARLAVSPRLSVALCIIEPSVGADVHICRKGWKASQAFISEIIGETMSLADASNLLSIAWRRNIDIRRIYHESR